MMSQHPSRFKPFPNEGYVFSHWLLDGENIGSDNPVTVQMNQPHTLVGVFEETVSLIFSAEGLGSDASVVVLIVDGEEYLYDDLPVNFAWEVGSRHSFSWVDLATVSEGKRYAWVSTEGLSTQRTGEIQVPEDGGFVRATYNAI